MNPDPNDLSTHDLLALVQSGRELAGSVSLNTLLQNILNQACSLTSSSDASVILLDERRQALYFAAATGEKAALLLEKWGESGQQVVPLQGSMAGTVFSSGKAAVFNEIAEDPGHFKAVDEDTRRSTTSMVCVPLEAAGQRFGVIQILNKSRSSYTRRDLILLDHFAAQAAVAIRNARMFSDLLAHMGFYASHGPDLGPEEVLAELAQPAHNELLSVLFADMRGFTQLCYILSRPEQVQRLLNNFLGMLADAVVANRGLVNKFLGDGALALFRGKDHALHAVQCAFAMLEEFDRLKTGWDAQVNAPLQFLDLGVGIATDTVILGSVGSSRIREFTAVGSAVNLAEYFVEQARQGHRVLVDKMTFRSVQDHLGEYEGPAIVDLKKAGQTVGHPYERYLLKSLRSQSESQPVRPAAAPAAQPAAAFDVFISYSHKDRKWLEKLQTHLKPYLRGGSIEAWDDTRIQPGARWQAEIQHCLEATRIAVLLVSPDFLESDFIATRELPRLLEAAQNRGVTIFWVPISASSFEETEIGSYQALMDTSQPMDTLSEANQNKVWVSLCKKIKAALHGEG